MSLVELSPGSAIAARAENVRRMIHRAGGSRSAADVVEEELAR
ncbi:hypothetical protein [Lentzea sp. CC55]|nr:hypothetical protein [Lentzea sp. CC55]